VKAVLFERHRDELNVRLSLTCELLLINLEELNRPVVLITELPVKRLVEPKTDDRDINEVCCNGFDGLTKILRLRPIVFKSPFDIDIVPVLESCFVGVKNNCDLVNIFVGLIVLVDENQNVKLNGNDGENAVDGTRRRDTENGKDLEKVAVLLSRRELEYVFVDPIVGVILNDND
jgi:hypothetical protein